MNIAIVYSPDWAQYAAIETFAIFKTNPAPVKVYDAVLQDINNVLLYQPKNEVLLLIHDSWYEPSREAINSANWNDSPYVHFVEKDFVAGDLFGDMLIGGLSLARLLPVERQGDVQINQNHDHMYRMFKELMSK